MTDPEDIEVGDTIRFEFGNSPHTSLKEVTEVNERSVKVVGGGTVFYRSIKQVLPANDR